MMMPIHANTNWPAAPHGAPHRKSLPALIRCTLLLSLAASGQHALGHHSFAMYDSKQLITVTGTIKSFQWSNPHAIVWLIDGPKKDGASDLWTLELPTSPGVLTRLGWNKHSLQPGDRVIVEFNPLRDGEHGGSFKKATLVDSGKVLAVNITTPAAKPDPGQP
jgi:Family of unknown function (DUF6152)